MIEEVSLGNDKSVTLIFKGGLVTEFVVKAPRGKELRKLVPPPGIIREQAIQEAKFDAIHL
jgi:hypothetical protein